MSWRMAAMVVVAGAACGQGSESLSREKEAALGARLAQEMRQRTKAIKSAVVSGYVEKLGRKLAAQFPEAERGYQFAVIADKVGGRTHEAVWFPGGYIFVPAGLILAAEDEAELAGMLAHAMVHVAEHHLATIPSSGNVTSIPLIFMGGWSDKAGAEVALPVAVVKSCRIFELEADQRAVSLVAGAGYDPEGLRRYVGRLQTAVSDREAMYSRLPPREVRMAGLEEAIGKLPAKDSYSMGGAEFQRTQEEVRTLTAVREAARERPEPPTLRRRDGPK